MLGSREACNVARVAYGILKAMGCRAMLGGVLFARKADERVGVPEMFLRFLEFRVL